MLKPLRSTVVPRSPAILVLSLSLVSPAAAQEEQPVCAEGQAQLVGVVVDAKTEMRLAGALVSVEASEWASLTTENGRFLLCQIGGGTHILTAERLGYADFVARADVDASGDPVVIRMEPDPVLLEGLEVVADRFERRRRAAAFPVRAFDQEDLATSGYWSAADFIEMQAGIMTTPCGFHRCIYYRGGMVNPTIYLDEFPLIGGWAHLESIPTSQLYMVEVNRGGTHIRAYTHNFMKRAAKVRLAPMMIW